MIKKLFYSFVAIVIILASIACVWKVNFRKQKDYIPRSPVNRQLVVYNKVAKCGSSSILATTAYLTKNLGMDYKVYQHPVELRQEKLGKRMSKENAGKEANIIAVLPRPALYARHVYYLNFTEFNLTKPIYINMVRDPVDRFVSNFYFDQFGSFGQNVSKPIHPQNINECVLKRLPRCSSKYFLSLYMTRFFCGHDQACNADEKTAVEIAKRNIMTEYTLIGLTEEFENSLILFEKLLPNFFRGALEAWRVIKNEKFHRYSTVQKDEISPEARQMLKEKMWADYEIYFFIKQRFNEIKVLHNVF